jgi:hypothetical protein
MPVSSCFKLRTDKHQAEMPKEQQRDFAAVLQRFCSGFAAVLHAWLFMHMIYVHPILSVILIV